VVWIGVGLSAGAFGVLRHERARWASRAVVVTEGEACDHGAWAVVIRDGDRRSCLSTDDVRNLLRRHDPERAAAVLAYECAPPPAAPADWPGL
jgi:hypothetical protein